MFNVSFTISGSPKYKAAVDIVPPPAPSLISITSPAFAPSRDTTASATPTAPTQPVIRSPITTSPPILNVEPVTRGTPVASDTVEIPAIWSNIFATSPSSATWMSDSSAIGTAPITYTSRSAARATWNPARNGKSLSRECIPSTVTTTNLASLVPLSVKRTTPESLKLEESTTAPVAPIISPIFSWA